jgi:hypothetical protein
MGVHGMSSRAGAKVVTLLVVVAGLTGAIVPATASAADDSVFNCDALALRATLLTLTPIVLGTANAGAANCNSVDGTVLTIPASAGLPLTAGVLVATTGVNPGVRAASVGAVTGLGVGLGGSVLSQITGPISQALTGSSGPITLNDSLVQTLLTSLGLSGSTPTLTQGDLAHGLQLILNSLLSNVLNGSIVGIGVAGATASTTCVNGAPVLKGSSQIAGLNVLGQNVPLDGVANQALNLLNTGQLQNLNLADTVNELVANLETALGLPTIAQNDPGLVGTVNQLVAELTSLVNQTVQPLLTSLLQAAQPLIDQVIHITVQPNTQTIANGQLTQTALHINVTLLNNPLLDLIVGRARVSNASAGCGTNTQVPSLCTTRRLVLLDTFQQGNHAFLAGAAADAKFVGRSVAIYYDPSGNGGKVVAHAKVGANGLFQTTAPLPPLSQRFTNQARFYASALGEKSLRLKFYRRMHVTGISSSGGKVHISGRVDPPLSSPVSRIVIQRRISCTKVVNVTTIAGTASGSFSATLAAPPSGQVGVYRATTFVRATAHNPKRFPTFTLPRYVDIG